MVLVSGPAANDTHWEFRNEVDFEQSYVQQWAGTIGVASGSSYNLRPWRVALAEHQTASLIEVYVDCLGGAGATFNVVYGQSPTALSNLTASALVLGAGPSSASWSPSGGVDFMDGDYIGIAIATGSVSDLAVTYRLSTQIRL